MTVQLSQRQRHVLYSAQPLIGCLYVPSSQTGVQDGLSEKAIKVTFNQGRDRYDTLDLAAHKQEKGKTIF